MTVLELSIGGGTQTGKVNIILSTSAGQDMSQACFQMAHETVHLLAPVRIEDATNLEEGVACYFSLVYMEKKRIEPKLYYDMKSYKHVLKLVTPRLKEDRYCIRRLRERQPSFRDISKEEITQGISRVDRGGCVFSHIKVYTGRRLTNGDRRIHSLHENEEA